MLDVQLGSQNEALVSSIPSAELQGAHGNSVDPLTSLFAPQPSMSCRTTVLTFTLEVTLTLAPVWKLALTLTTDRRGPAEEARTNIGF